MLQYERYIVKILLSQVPSSYASLGVEDASPVLAFAREAVSNLCGQEEKGLVWWQRVTPKPSGHWEPAPLWGARCHVDIRSHCASQQTIKTRRSSQIV